MVDTDGLEYEDLIDDEGADPAQEERKPFVVDSDSSAEWVMRKIKELDDEDAKWKRFYEERLKAYLESNKFKRAYLKSLLVPYMNKVLCKETKTQIKYSLPSGDMVIKKEHYNTEHDDDVLLTFLSVGKYEEYIKTKASVDWKKLKADLVEKDGEFYLGETGEKVQGVKSVLVPASFEVNPKDPLSK